MDLSRIFADKPAGARCLGVVGYPLDYTLFPAMHTAAIQFYGFNAIYKALRVPEEEWDDFYEKYKTSPLHGFNVTRPYKEKFFRENGNSFFVALTGAVNTVTRGANRWGYDNTDGDGFLEDLGESGIDLGGKDVVVLGAGGAACALLGAIYKEGLAPKSVTLVNRTVSRAEHLKERIRSQTQEEFLGAWRLTSRSGNPRAFVLEVAKDKKEIESAIKRASVIVNAASIGQDDPHEPPIFEFGCLQMGVDVYDLVYHHETDLMKKAKERGARKIAGGLGMLVNQGALAFELWFEEELKNKKYNPRDLRKVMRRAAEAELRRRSSL